LDHLFIDCPFTQEVWTQAMHGLNAQTPSQLTVVNLFASWKGRSPHALKRKTMWAKIWYAIPKYICWEVWLARNEATFNNCLRPPTVVAAKAKALLLETLENRPHKTDSVLLPEEISWLGAPLKRVSNKKNTPRPCSDPEWRLRTPEQDFQKWWKNQGKVTIFFDGASKGNPGTSGAGGVIYSPDGQSKDNFSWGLGQSTNNQA
jgi:hypothetical protein